MSAKIAVSMKAVGGLFVTRTRGIKLINPPLEVSILTEPWGCIRRSLSYLMYCCERNCIYYISIDFILVKKKVLEVIAMNHRRHLVAN